MDNGISGEGSVEEKQAGYLRKASFCSNFDFTDETKTSWLRKVQMHVAHTEVLGNWKSHSVLLYYTAIGHFRWVRWDPK